MAPSEKKGAAAKKAAAAAAAATIATTTTGINPTADNPAAEAKQEQELEASIARLRSARDQLTEMRSAVQNMLQPLHYTSGDPELVYAAFADSAQKAVQDIKNFQTVMRDEKMKELLKRSKEWSSKLDNGNGSAWLGGLNSAAESWQHVGNGLDNLKIEGQDSSKKG